ncbi:MAG TPA: hypothetical protein VI461_17185 [Chitinophagaceae bacterium]|nr:hypothetical protein [Chitinophagaceae bacterium]
MKKLLLLLSFSFTCMLSQSQSAKADSWKIVWKKKTILETSKEDETANTKKITKTDLDKTYFLEISYKEGTAKNIKALRRSFLFYGESDNELLRKDSTRNAKIPAAELKKIFADQKKIKIYTIAIPTDPNIAARVRIRRVHLCTLELQ